MTKIKRKLFKNFVKENMKMKIFKEKEKRLKRIMKNITLYGSMLRWRYDIILIDSIIVKYKKAVLNYCKKVKKNVFRCFKLYHVQQQQLAIILHKLSQRRYINIMAESLESIDEYNCVKVQQIDEKLIGGTNKIFYILSKIQAKRLSDTLIYVKEKSIDEALKREKVKRVMIKWSNQKLKAPFIQWVKKVEEKLLIEGVEGRGKTVQQIMETLHQHKSLITIIQSERLEKVLTCLLIF